jgi:hypothetical protein
MPTQPIVSSRPAPSHHRSTRTAAAITAIAALIAVGSYLASTTGDDTAPPGPAISTRVKPSDQTLREMHQSIAGQYGSQSAAGAVVNPGTQVRRELRQSIAGQYRSTR